MSGMKKRDAYIGSEAIEKRNLVHLNHPMERGVITDMDAMESVWWHAICNGVVLHYQSLLTTRNASKPFRASNLAH